MTPRALVVTGSLVLVVALLLAALGASLRGSFNPACDSCAPLSSRVLFFSALPVSIIGALLVGMGLARREAVAEEFDRTP
ncbi:MAG: hypothetical protein WDA16_06250 [Candidatus Thermoplasmatota archaeon]